MSGRQRLESASPSAYDANTRAADLEIGALFFSLAVIAFPSVIVGGIVLAYMLFVS